MWWISVALAMPGPVDAFASLAQPGPRVVCDMEVSSSGEAMLRSSDTECPVVRPEVAAELVRVAPMASVGTWPHVARIQTGGIEVVGVRVVAGRQRVRLRALPVARVVAWVGVEAFGVAGPSACEVEVSVTADGEVSHASSACPMEARAAEAAAKAWRFEPVTRGEDAVAWQGTIVVPLTWTAPAGVEPLGLPATTAEQGIW